MGCDARAVAGEAKVFFRGGLDADGGDVCAERVGDAGAHRVDIRCELRPLGDDGRIEVAEPPSMFRQNGGDGFQKLDAVCAEIAVIVPTAENIKYIDQSVAKATASNGSVSFDIYPQNHTSALVRIISVNAATNKVTDENIAAVKLNYTLGDVTGEGEVNAVDALRILQYAANVGNPKYEFSAPWAAGDVDLNGEISGVDAVRILQYAANDGNPKYALGK